MKIGFIGLGNMASAIIVGIIKAGIATRSGISGYDVIDSVCLHVKERFGINTVSSNEAVIRESEIIFLAVKPQFLEAMLKALPMGILNGKIMISIAPGKTIAWLQSLTGEKTRIIRTMPNTPALVGAGATGYCCNEHVTDEDMNSVLTILNSFGIAVPVSEHQMDAVVGISGSSPAYAFMFIESLADAGVAAGLPRAESYRLSAQALLGSAKMVLETGAHPGALKDMVCSPGGTTIEAVRVLEEKGFRAAVMDAVEACVEKSKSM